jgi:hypothetical protein
MRPTLSILDAHGREAQLPSSRQLAPRMPAVLPVGRSAPPAPIESAFASGCRRAFQVVDAMLGVIFAVAVIALLAFGCVWLLGLLFGRRGDR